VKRLGRNPFANRLDAAQASSASSAPALAASETRRSLVYSSLEGMSASVVGACSSGAVLIAWANSLGASPLILSVLWALPYLAQLAQPVAAWLTSVAGARRLAIGSLTLSRQVLWVLVFLPLLPSPAVARGALIVSFSVVAVAGVVGTNAWTSWVAVLVPARLRGRYFGPRSARAALVGTVASIGVGAWIDRASARGFEVRALAWTSACGALAGLVCSALMSRQHEPRAPERQATGHLPPSFVLATFADPGVRRLLAFQAIWSASTGVAASIYNVHALTSLGIGVTGLAIYGTALAASRLFATPLWGRALDRSGPRQVLVLCTMLSGCGSALWVATRPGCAWPIAVDAIVSGVALGGVELAIFAMPLEMGAPAARHGVQGSTRLRPSRPAVVGAAAMVSGLAFGVASVAGGAMMTGVSAAGVPGATRALFALSAMGRVLGALFATRLAPARWRKDLVIL
jgi:hypothetical protein